MRKKVLSLAVIFILMLTNSVAFAGTDSNERGELKGGPVDLSTLPEDERKLIEERSKQFGELILEKAKEEASFKKLVNKKGKSRSDITAMDDSKFKIENIDRKLKELGFEKLKNEKDSQVSILSTAGDMDSDWNDVYLYYDTGANKYVFGGNFYWANDDWLDDFRGHCGFHCMQGDVGGTNGFYIASLHKDINTYYEEFRTLHSDETTDEDWTNTASTYSSSRGYGWEFQDSVLFPNTYNAWGALGWFYFDFVDGVPTGESISFKASYGHTWSTDYINSISVGPWSFGFGWGTSNHSWNKDENYVHRF